MSPDTRSSEKLVIMANQIAGFFRAQPGTDQAERVAAHLNDFWDPGMRAQFLALAEAGAAFDPLVRAAVPFVRRPVD